MIGLLLRGFGVASRPMLSNTNKPFHASVSLANNNCSYDVIAAAPHYCTPIAPLQLEQIL